VELCIFCVIDSRMFYSFSFLLRNNDHVFPLLFLQAAIFVQFSERWTKIDSFLTQEVD